MWKNNRPDGWKTFWESEDAHLDNEDEIYEAGADAMLKKILIKLQAIYNLPDGGMFHKQMGEFIKRLRREVS